MEISDISGEYARFFLSIDAQGDTLDLTLYTELGTTRTLVDNEWFYITDIGWVTGGVGFTGYLFDDIGDDDTPAANNILFVFDTGLPNDMHAFEMPVPTRTPTFVSDAEVLFWGHGFIRSA